jgi:nicotinamidase-related amidase
MSLPLVRATCCSEQKRRLTRMRGRLPRSRTPEYRADQEWGRLMPRAVLVVIDMLNDFFDRSELLASQRGRLVTATNQLARGVRATGSPVFWVRQEFAPDLSDAFPEMRRRKLSITIAGTPGCQILSELERAPEDVTIVKKRYSAFFGTDLEERLSQLRPELLLISGVNTHACVRTTVIDAYQRDYETIVAAECVASYDPEHHEVTARYLNDKVAPFMSSASILALLGAPPNPPLQRT